MASIIEVRDLLALHGRMGVTELSRRLHTSQPMMEAMLMRLEAMGKAGRVVVNDEKNCLRGSCKRCAEGKTCQTVLWTLLKQEND